VFLWFYYDYINSHGNNVGSRVLMFIVAIMNAGRGALSFFMLLIVCMGYSIVKYPPFPTYPSDLDHPSVLQCGNAVSLG